jgi:hypothetical protein
LNWYQSLSSSEKIVISLIRGNQYFIRCLDEMKICDNLPEEQELMEYLIWNKLIPVFNSSIIRNKLLEEYFTSDFLRELNVQYRFSILKHLQLEGVFRTIIPLFQKEGIDFVPFKGTVLSQQVYETPALRPMLDIDLLVAPKDVAKAKDILLNIGASSMYEIESKHTMGLWRHIPPLIYRGIPIEIHQQLFLSYEESYIHTNEIIQKITQETIYDMPCQVLSPEHHLFYLIYHLHKHVTKDYIRLIWFLDIRLYWEKHQYTLKKEEFETLLTHSNELYRKSLWAIQEILSINIIDPPDDSYKMDHEQMVSEYLMKCKNPDFQNQEIRSIDVIRNLTGLKQKLLFIKGRIFPTPSYVSSKYKIRHKPLILLYYPVLYVSYLKKVFRVITARGNQN